MSVLVERFTVTIASGSSVSSAAVLKGKVPTVLQMPDGWDAAAISFITTGDGAVFRWQYDTAGAVITIPAGVERRIFLPASLADTRNLYVVSGVPGAAVNQTADRVIYIEVWE